MTTSDADDDTVAFGQYWSDSSGRRLDWDTIPHSDSTIGEWTCTVEADDGYDLVTESLTVQVVELPKMPEERTRFCLITRLNVLWRIADG